MNCYPFGRVLNHDPTKLLPVQFVMIPFIKHVVGKNDVNWFGTNAGVIFYHALLCCSFSDRCAETSTSSSTFIFVYIRARCILHYYSLQICQHAVESWGGCLIQLASQSTMLDEFMTVFHLALTAGIPRWEVEGSKWKSAVGGNCGNPSGRWQVGNNQWKVGNHID